MTDGWNDTPLEDNPEVERAFSQAAVSESKANKYKLPADGVHTGVVVRAFVSEDSRTPWIDKELVVKLRTFTGEECHTTLELAPLTWRDGGVKDKYIEKILKPALLILGHDGPYRDVPLTLDSMIGRRVTFLMQTKQNPRSGKNYREVWLQRVERDQDGEPSYDLELVSQLDAFKQQFAADDIADDDHPF